MSAMGKSSARDGRGQGRADRGQPRAAQVQPARRRLRAASAGAASMGPAARPSLRPCSPPQHGQLSALGRLSALARLNMLSQLGLRSQTSTASFVVVSRASGSPSSPAALTPRPAPSLAVWRRALLFLAVLDLAVTLAFSGVLRSDKMLLLSTVAVTRAAVVAAVGCSRRSGTTGAGAGWVSGASASSSPL